MQKFQLQDKQAISAIVCIQTPTYIVNIDKSLLAIGGWLGLFRNNILTRPLVRNQRDPWYHNSTLPLGSIHFCNTIYTILSEVVRSSSTILCINAGNPSLSSWLVPSRLASCPPLACFRCVVLAKIADFLAFWEKLFIKTRKIWVGIQQEVIWGLGRC